MQLISVERWTFWTAVVLAVATPVLSTGIGVIYSSTGANSGTSWDVGAFVGALVWVVLLVSVASGGSRDPSVRSVPASPRA
jgi:hypothetical protein